MNAPGFVVTENVTQADGRQYLLANNGRSGLVLSVTLEKVAGTATLEGCHENFQRRIQSGGPFELSNIQQSRSGDVEILEYLIPKANDIPVRQQNLFGCLVKENVYADIHLSKADYKSSDEPLLKAVLDSTGFTGAPDSAQTNSPPAGSAAFLAEGDRHFVRNEFDKAIGPLRKLSIWRKKHELWIRRSGGYWWTTWRWRTASQAI